jgi:tetratricopeptide (TPR) repeat protein
MFNPFSQLFNMRRLFACSMALVCLAWPLNVEIAWAEVETNTSQAQAKAAEKAFDQGHYAEALVLFEQALQAEPDRIYWLRLMAESYQYLGRFAEAEAVLNTALERFPQEALLLEGLGWLKLFQKDFKAAESWLRKAGEQEPDGFWIQLNLAYALLFQGREADAFELLCQLGRSPEGPSLGTAMKKDFAKLAKFKITHPDSDTLTELFTSRCGLGLVLPEACTPKPTASKANRP